MAKGTKIEWTEETWNPIAGCSVVSPGCTNCYAMKRVAPRLAGNPATPHYAGTVEASKAGPVWTGKIGVAGDRKFLEPLRWTRPRLVFVNSTSDLFHPGVPDEVIDRVFAVMALAPQHTFQVLTKRAQRMREYLSAKDRVARISFQMGFVSTYRGFNGMVYGHAQATRFSNGEGWPLPNVWLGISAEDQKRADERIPHLLATPAAVRWVSAEPLLGPIDLMEVIPKPIIYNAVHGMKRLLAWIVAGGESGHDARPMSSLWVRELQKQCDAASVRFFFKQWGEWKPAGVRPSGSPGTFAFGDYEYDRERMVRVDGYPRQFTMFGARSVMERVGKKAAGRLLDGREYNDMPEIAA